jgi:hypothetical protein
MRDFLEFLGEMERKGEVSGSRSGHWDGPLDSGADFDYQVRIGIECAREPFFRTASRHRHKPQKRGPDGGRSHKRCR